MAAAVSDDELRGRLLALFQQNPVCLYENDDPMLPAWALVPVLNQLAHDLRVQPLSEESIASLQSLADAGEDAVNVTADHVAQIVPHLFPELTLVKTPSEGSPELIEGRPDAEDSRRRRLRSSSLSPEPEPRASTRRTAAATPTPLSIDNMRYFNASSPTNSPFDVRQRSTPLSATSFSARIQRPIALVRRRRSDSASTSGGKRPLSDSDSRPLSPTSGTLSPRSIPTSPSSGVSFPSPWIPNDGALGGGRSVSQPMTRQRSSVEPQFASIHELDWEDHPEYTGPHSPADERQMPFASLHDTPRRRTVSWAESYDSEEEYEGLVIAPRSTRTSTASMAPHERVEALKQENADLMRRLAEAERIMHARLSEQEGEFQELEHKLAEAEDELTSMRREDKDLRSKDRSNITQISILEHEVAKLQRQVDSTRATSQTMQKQYQDQINATEALRNALRAKDADVQYVTELAQQHAAEAQKHLVAREMADAQTAQLEEELAAAREAFNSADENNEENVLLRETIERLRLDLDELRAGSGGSDRAPGSRDGSRPGTLNRSLGVEMLMQLADAERRRFLDSGANKSPDRSMETDVNLDSDAETKPKDTQENEREPTYQTLITRKRVRDTPSSPSRFPDSFEQKVPSRSIVPPALSPSRFLPPKALFSEAQPQHEPRQSTSAAAARNEEIEIDTSGSEPSTSPPDPPSVLARRPPTPQTPTRRPTPTRRLTVQETEAYEDELYKMVVAPVSPTSPPRAQSRSRPLKSPEMPPSYAQLFAPQKLAKARAIVAKNAVALAHLGAPMPLAPVSGGVSHDALAAWGKLKGELGVECVVIDKVLAASVTRTPPASPPPSTVAFRPAKPGSLRRRRSVSISSSTPATAPESSHRPSRREHQERSKKAAAAAAKQDRWRLSDLLNVHAARERLPRKLFYPIVVLGAWTAVVVVTTPFVTHYFAVPGVPDAADRAALTALRALAGGVGEGFPGAVFPDARSDTLDAVWKVVEQLLLGSANAVLRVPV